MKSAKPSRSATVPSARPPCGKSSGPKGLRHCPGAWTRNGPSVPGPTIEPVADVREFSLAPRKFTTAVGGFSCSSPIWCAWGPRSWHAPLACPVPR